MPAAFGTILLAASALIAAQPSQSSLPAAPPAGEARDIDFAAPVSNAALLYNRVWLLETEGSIKKASEADWSDPAFTLTPELARNLEANAGVIAGLLRAARIHDCDWGVEYDQGFAAMLPHLGKLRASARLLAVDARAKAQTGDPTAAAERAAAIFVLARHAAGDRLLISALVSQAIANLAIDLSGLLVAGGAGAAGGVAPLSIADQARILAAAKDLDGPDAFRIRAGVAGEAAMVESWLAPRCTGPAAGQAFLQLTSAADLQGDAPQRRELLAGIASADEARMQADLAQAAQVVRDTLAAWDLPDSVARIEAIGAKVEQGSYGPAASVIAPSLAKANASSIKAAARLRDFIARLESASPAANPPR